MSRTLVSASGLRPFSAFVVIAGVVVAVFGRVCWLVATATDTARELRVHHEAGSDPAYTIEDRSGVPLAVFLERVDLEMCPRVMWQAHTPGRMAQRIADVLGGAMSKSVVLAAMFPDAVGSVVEVESWSLDRETALRIDAFVRGEGEFERAAGPLPGIGLELRSNGTYQLAWEPAVLLSQTTREGHGCARSPLSWSRRLADGLGQAVFGPHSEGATEKEKEQRRNEVWAALLPSMWTRVALDVPSALAPDLASVLREEGVESHQMWVSTAREREYPAGEFPVLGHWGFLDEEQEAPLAYSGLERLCDQFLMEEKFSFIHLEPATYSWRRERPARQRLRPYYLGRVEATEPPRFRVTLDISLQRFVRRRLETVMAEHDPAVALAMAVDVQTGEVLASDGLAAYGMAAFPPVKHLFMPGSTFKVVTMATALEAGVVRPEDEFAVGNGKWVLSVGGRTRTISEAEGSATGTITAAECLAHSVNAGLVQIGLQVPPEVFRGRLDELGYGRRPEAGLGGEERGLIPGLPWKTLYSHASVCYGYEVLTTSWQHMQALCTILRGGIFRELTIAQSFVHDGERFDLRDDEERRVFSRETCDTVRGMMALGAREGTGRKLYREDIEMGSKTGTAERVDDEVCLHVYGRRAQELEAAGVQPTQRDYKALRGVREDHSRCHTSSIVVFGSLPGPSSLSGGPPDGGGREVAVLVVVDEPRSGERFGSRVAGPAAMDILGEALGLTRSGLTETQDLVAGFADSEVEAALVLDDADRDRPWRAR